MFERYTERARRVVFFARYEACQLGYSQIDSEHLLLGLIREDKALVCSFLTDENIKSILSAIESSAKGDISTLRSVDLPLSLGGKLALKNASDQADQRSDRHIGTEHLLLGLLSQTSSLAAQLLIQHGATPERVLQGLKKQPSAERLRTESPKRRSSSQSPPWIWPDAT